MSPLEILEAAAQQAASDVVGTALTLAKAEAEHHVASQNAARLLAALRALKGEAPLVTERVAAEKTAEPPAPPPSPPAPARPQGGICMACERPAVFPTTRTMKGVPITVNTCQECGCDNLL